MQQLAGILNNGGFINPVALAGETYVPAYYPGTIDPAAARPLDLRPGAAMSGVDLGVSRTRGVRVRGQVIGGTTAQIAAGAVVTIHDQTSAGFSSTSLGATSSFDFSGIPPGAYVIQASVSRQALGGSLVVNVGKEDINDLRLVVQPSFGIAGRVTIEGRPAGANDSDLAKMRVQLETVAQPAGSATVQPDGSFKTSNVLMAADHRFGLNGLPPNAYLKAARIGTIDALTGAVHLETTPESPLELLVSLNAGNVDGVVTDENQRPAAGAVVALVPDPALRKRYELYRSAIADEAGRVRIDGVAPGNYKVFAWENMVENAWQDTDVIHLYEERGEAVKVTEGSKQEMKLKMIR